MTEQALRRADELLTDLVEIVETARALPMSSSCVVPREQMLDLLDALREVMPPEMAQARSVVARRDTIEQQAHQASEETLAEARAEGERLVYAARVQAHELLESARAEQAMLLSASSIHQLAEQEAAAKRADAEQYAQSVRRGGEQYANQTLSDLVDLLTSAARTAENGRRALVDRTAAADAAAAGGDAQGQLAGEWVEDDLESLDPPAEPGDADGSSTGDAVDEPRDR
ncbi:MAG: large Ala/Glu-rich protein [Pseudonocardiales bacterium]|nr:large Ala/Glu-rich protein [Pseudonocardiales bacterium]